MITKVEVEFFNSLLNRDGYVLDFSTSNFNNFTYNSMGLKLCDIYGLPKGKSLYKFMNEGDHNKVTNLLGDLLNYYEVKYNSEIKSNKTISLLYAKCKEIINRENDSSNKFTEEASNALKKKFSSNYINQQIDIMIKMCAENPTEAIGKSKELIESCCKTIIENLNENFSNSESVGKLIKRTCNLLNIPNQDIEMDSIEKKLISQIIGNLNGLSSGIVELRNHYGSGHGHSSKFNGLTKRHADLSVGASITLVRYLWDTFLFKKHAHKKTQ